MMRYFMLKKKRTTNLIHLLSLLFFVSTSAFSQEKYEKEYRIKTAKVPQAALEFIHSAGFAKKVKWYREEGLTSNSIEAKTKHHKTKYSIEFNTAGEIEDVEYIIQWEDMPALTRINIENLDKQYRIGEIGTGTLSHDINRWWYKIRGKEDPYKIIGSKNDRTSKISSEYVWALKNINFDVKDGEVVI